MTCLTCLIDPIVMEFQAKAHPVVNGSSDAIATLSQISLRVMIHNFLERPGIMASAVLYIKTSDSQRMRFTVLGDVPAGDWPLIKFKATLDAPADLNLLEDAENSVHINAAIGHVIYQTGGEPSTTTKTCTTNQDCETF